MAEDEYFSVKGSLKLKGVADSGIKKKKKKSHKENLEASLKHRDMDEKVNLTRTKAEQRFLERQQQMEEHRIRKKASKTHKEKVEEFNRNLDAQSEHFDIPKVSWTK